jgi:flagellar P-ring protein precursor FlgI
MVEREVEFDFLAGDKVRFIMNESDFTTMDRAVSAVNQLLGSEYARPLNPRVLEVMIPTEFSGNRIAFVSRIENLALTPDIPAKIVINERTGTIIIGENARISKVAIAHGNLTINIQTENVAVPSGALIGGADTVTQTNDNTQVDEPGPRIMVSEEGISLGEIAATLNSLRVTPRDIIAIFQALKEAGAIHAELKLI